MKLSIVIPTYNHLEDLLKPLCRSIIDYTDLNDIEIIVVANGCKDGTEDYVKSLGEPFKLISYPEPSGYTFSTNRGIELATGDYVVLLNNDCAFLPQEKNSWVNILLEPFQDPKVMATGPMKTFCHQAQTEFLIGFCVCYRKEVFQKLGLMDECFNPGYGEDTDLICRIVEAGYDFKQVCPSDTYDGPNRMIGGFPIYHAGNQTFKDVPGGDALFLRNNKILQDRYSQGVCIDRAMNIPGFMNTWELKWLAVQAKTKKTVVEIGSWMGRSSRSIAEHLPADGVLYCVDTWAGSKGEPTNPAWSNMFDADEAFKAFCSNNFNLIRAGKIIPIRMTSVNAAKLFAEKGIKFDEIFIDGGHTYEEVCEDIDAWKDLLADDGLFCGHDYNGWHGVNVAVEEKISNFKVSNHTTIWYCGKGDINKNKPSVFDVVPFNNELDILEIRLNTLYDVVDRFIIVEAPLTHQNQPKPLNFHNNLKRFEKFLHKITYIVVEDFLAKDSWSIERNQRDAGMRGLTNCKDGDICIISDLDEIPSPEAIRNYRASEGIKSLDMNFYYYNFNCKSEKNWHEGKILPYGLLKQLTPCGARYTQCDMIPNGGWHFSYFGNIDHIIKKIGDFAHVEYSTPEFKDRARVEKAVREGLDLFGRDEKFKYVKLDNTYPKYVLDNLDKYSHLIYMKD